MVWPVYEQIRVLCGSENHSSLVAPSIQSNRAAQMVFALWEVWSHSSQRPGRPRKNSKSSRWGSFDSRLGYFYVFLKTHSTLHSENMQMTSQVIRKSVDHKQKVKQMLLLLLLHQCDTFTTRSFVSSPFAVFWSQMSSACKCMTWGPATHIEQS